MSQAIDLAVIGAGPAGLAAALEARRLGLEVLVLDEGPVPGGQYYRQPHVPVRDGVHRLGRHQQSAGAALIEDVLSAGATIWSQATVWGLFPDRRIALEHEGIGKEIVTRRLILATGAHDRTLAFPGWTLPGVVTPGAVQSLMKSDQVMPGRQAVVAGCGPFLLVVASQLLAWGVKVAAVIESTRWNWNAFGGFLQFAERWRELFGYLGPLLRAGVPILRGHAVLEAQGSDRVEAVSVAPLDARGQPVLERRREIAADLLAVAHGFRVVSELSSIAGCAHDFDETRGGYFCRTDPDTCETTVPGVFAAGETAGFAGARVALLAGRIAGISAAKSLGVKQSDAALRLEETRHAREREQRFANLVNRTFAPPPGLVSVITDDTVICRCEEVPALEVGKAVAAGARTATAVKMWTRCGMGRCQGRICGWTLNRYVASLTGASAADVGQNTPRIPAKPVRLDSVLAGAEAAKIWI